MMMLLMISGNVRRRNLLLLLMLATGTCRRDGGNFGRCCWCWCWRRFDVDAVAQWTSSVLSLQNKREYLCGAVEHSRDREWCLENWRMNGWILLLGDSACSVVVMVVVVVVVGDRRRCSLSLSISAEEQLQHARGQLLLLLLLRC